MVRTRIKFCGMTRVADAVAAASLGVDAIGMVFTRRSKRFVELERAAEIVAALPPLVASVALFLDAEPDWVRQVERRVKPTLLQFHGSESDDYCAAFDTPFIKAIAMRSAPPAERWAATWPHARGFLLDGHAAGEVGGTGAAFDHAQVPIDRERPLILAGGLDASNVAAAIRSVRPWAVDVASGIETSPGIKSRERMLAFVQQVRTTES